MSNSVRVVNIRDCAIGGAELMVMAGPCSIESREQILHCAEVVAGCVGPGIRSCGGLECRVHSHSDVPPETR